MLGNGLVALIQANIDPTLNVAGGYLSQLPKDLLASPAYTYQIISDRSHVTLRNIRGLSEARVQFDCFGPSPDDPVRVVKEVDRILHGFVGVLPDSDATQVNECFQSDLMDFGLDPGSRSYRRMIEFEILYYPS